MKTLYTILFFLDTLALILISYLFLKQADKGSSEIGLLALLCGIVLCVIFLIYIMVRFFKHPGSKIQR